MYSFNNLTKRLNAINFALSPIACCQASYWYNHKFKNEQLMQVVKKQAIESGEIFEQYLAEACKPDATVSKEAKQLVRQELSKEEIQKSLDYQYGLMDRIAPKSSMT